MARVGKARPKGLPKRVASKPSEEGTSAPRADSGRPDWSESIDIHYSAHSILRLHPELAFYILRWDGEKTLAWRDLNDTVEQIQPFHFEIHYGKESARDEYYLQVLREVQRTRKFTVTTLHGFHDLFYPIEADRTGLTFIYAGQFCRETLDWEGIASRWRELTGHAPAPANPDFVRFVRMVLSLPVVDDHALSGLERFVALLGELLTGEHRLLSSSERIEALRRDVLVKHWPNHGWVNQAISAEKFHLTPWFLEGRFSQWMREEMHISRLPTTVLALMPGEAPGVTIDPVELIVRNYRIQLACMQHAIGLPDTGANRLQDYGVLFVTSPDPKQPPARARAELRDRARSLMDFVRQKFGVRSVVGIGRTLPPGEPLYPSYHEAVLALHLAVQLEKDILFYDEKYGSKEHMRYSELNDAALKLEEAFTRAKMDEIKLAADNYVRLALLFSNERVDVVRSQFLAMSFQIATMVQRRHQIRTQVVEQFCDELTAKLEAAASTYRLIETFREALERLAFFSSQALEGPKSMRLHATLEYLRQNYTEPLKLPDVARKAGFSVPAFSRIFKQATGTSFLAYLRAIRIDHAKMLLRGTALSTEQIAQACGFQSQHHLIRSFKKVTRQTPGEYRRAMTAKKSS